FIGSYGQRQPYGGPQAPAPAPPPQPPQPPPSFVGPRGTAAGDQLTPYGVSQLGGMSGGNMADVMGGGLLGGGPITSITQGPESLGTYAGDGNPFGAGGPFGGYSPAMQQVLQARMQGGLMGQGAGMQGGLMGQGAGMQGGLMGQGAGMQGGLMGQGAG